MIIKLYQPHTIHELGKRDNQEDFIYPVQGHVTAKDSLFIVCDGMGGHEHGELASGTFANALARFFEGRISPDVVLVDQTLIDGIEFAYSQLDAVDDGNLKKMGTTLTLLYFHRGGVTAAHIGDSRIFHIRPGKGLLYVSRDHSLVFDLFQSGEITYDEMRTHSSKNVITRAVQPGKENRVQPDIIHITDVQPGDYFYMCSDGMLEQMEDDELVQLLSSKGSDEKKRQQLIEATADNSDNHSAYLIHVESATREASDAALAVTNEEKTSRCNALNIMQVNARQSQEEDVKMVPPPYQPRENEPERSNKSSNLRKWLPLLMITVLVIGAWIWHNNRQQESFPVVQKVSDTIVQEDARSGFSIITHSTHQPKDSSKNMDAIKAQPDKTRSNLTSDKRRAQPADTPKMKNDPKVEKNLPKQKASTDTLTH